MENVLLDGFDNETPGNVRSIIARIADCGAREFNSATLWHLRTSFQFLAVTRPRYVLTLTGLLSHQAV